jgi:hypothetical protein
MKYDEEKSLHDALHLRNDPGRGGAEERFVEALRRGISPMKECETARRNTGLSVPFGAHRNPTNLND